MFYSRYTSGSIIEPEFDNSVVPEIHQYWTKVPDMVTLPDGRRIAADDMNEHVRVELIDPQARENRKKFLERQQKVS